MRTTVVLDDALMKKVKLFAAGKKKTLTEVFTEALTREVSEDRKKLKTFHLELITVSGRMRPGIDLSDRDSLYDAMGEDR
jgi:hypothetical protein